MIDDQFQVSIRLAGSVLIDRATGRPVSFRKYRGGET